MPWQSRRGSGPSVSAQSSYWIRPADAADAEEMIAVETCAAARFRSSPLAARAAALPHDQACFAEAAAAGRAWVAVDSESSIVGFLVLTTVGSRPHIEEMDVLPEHGGRGLGRRLLASAFEWAVAQGATEITLTTYRDVPWNRPFYERAGFCVLAPEDLDDALRDLVTLEHARGLARQDRVVMSHALALEAER
jgi:GNAT superfamily N-acetyltransferase